ncbi:hypothetical protein [Streptomyces sp. NPDC048419]|uniref:hypothetical protein n=1 Tax=Streptomyces sp. NPDC048419 TaxID=3365547 RepID=UPI00371DC331
MADSFMQQLIASLARRTPVLDEPVSYRAGSSEAADPSRPQPALLPADRHEFERVLDEVLAAETSRGSAGLTAEQQRTMALTAQDLIAATAAREYAHYREVRSRNLGLTSDDRASAEAPNGAGALAVTAVLVPVLGASAAAIFLVVGYVLKMVRPNSSIAPDLITGGWGFAAVAAAGTVLGAVGLLLSALRHAPHEDVVQDEEVAAARDAWLQVLRTRGMEPFLRDVRRAADAVVDSGRSPMSGLETDA